MTARKLKPAAETSSLLPRAPLLEWVTAICGLVASVGAIGYLTWDGLQPDAGQPVLSARAQGVTTTPSGYVVAFEVVNQSRVTASAVQVEGTLGDGVMPETATLTFDYVPGKGRREGSMMFEADPRRTPLKLLVKGQITP